MKTMMKSHRNAHSRLLGSLALVAFTTAAVGAVATAAPVEPAAGAAAQAAQYQNLQVLPADINRDALGRMMVDNLLGLGLPRRDGEGCLYCHVGDFDRPRDTWDYGSDDKVAKRKARAMMAMMASINDDHLAGLEARMSPDFEVSCATCHAGRIDPRPLPDILTETYRNDGIDETIARYRRLRSRYLGADAYDFRPAVLARLAGRFAGSGAFADAIVLASLNAEIHPDAGNANGTVLMLELQQSYAVDGVEAALQLFDGLSSGNRSRWVDYSLLDSLGWTINRRGDEDASVTIFRHNLERYPDQYIPHESLADALIFGNGREEGIALYESWLQEHPDHETARRRLTGLKQ